MNNRFEFRIWDNKQQQFVTSFVDIMIDESLHRLFIQTNSVIRAEDGYGNSRFFENSRFTIQQFTGLLDKNGKKIFEGDIIKFKGSLKNYNWRVVYSKDTACFMLADSADNAYWLMLNEVTKIEILGNVFENPKL